MTTFDDVMVIAVVLLPYRCYGYIGGVMVIAVGYGYNGVMVVAEVLWL